MTPLKCEVYKWAESHRPGIGYTKVFDYHATLLAFGHSEEEGEPYSTAIVMVQETQMLDEVPVNLVKVVGDV